jgi:methionyl-tRNA formyltransferase
MNKKIIFWGTPFFALPSLEALHDLGLVNAVITQSDKPSGRGQKPQVSPIKQYAEINKLPLIQVDDLDKNFVKNLKKFLPATFIIVAFGKMIPQDILDLSELRALNIHPSQLPLLRGPSPIQSALLEGFSSTAVSLMQLDEKMDHGPILGQIELEISPDDNYFSLEDKLADVGGELIKKSIFDYLSGLLKSSPQDHDQATRCKLIRKKDGLIDWTKPAENIINQVRAFILWPGSFTTLKGLELKITKAMVSLEKLAPEEIKIDSDRLLVGTGTEALQILELQPAGKKRMLATDFIRGYQNKL